MRVIVISVALLIAFVIMAIGFVKSERTPFPVAETVTTVVENPFADDTHKDKPVALPTLPPSASSSNASTTAADNQSSSKALNANASAISLASSANNEPTTKEAGPVASDNATNSDSMAAKSITIGGLIRQKQARMKNPESWG